MSDLNQDREAVKRIVEAVTAHNIRQRLQEEEIAKQEEEALIELKKKRREEEEEAYKSKGKEKMANSPIPSPKPLSFPELSPKRMDFEAEIKLKQEQAEEERQEELATLNALLDHYKREAQEANARCREHKAKWLEVSKKLAQQEEIIVRLTQEGVDLLPK